MNTGLRRSSRMPVLSSSASVRRASSALRWRTSVFVFCRFWRRSGECTRATARCRRTRSSSGSVSSTARSVAIASSNSIALRTRSGAAPRGSTVAVSSRSVESTSGKVQGRCGFVTTGNPWLSRSGRIAPAAHIAGQRRRRASIRPCS
ncbi:MAG: hypothetical protein AVDCRST_MAG71-2845 [uncultured Lysobacter sp.]|uniref:Uncharacterized protein n=1 Tax=uncultured Lysobacter sp. TaxID=271060 RepID=A0A6J4M876_9GAMM|nr:MAG: hypothetical protein AVDCRST_MAG71-2845 [uncultured Lysobacter sp.]